MVEADFTVIPNILTGNKGSLEKVLMSLDAGALLYPTRTRTDGFWEVEDNLGIKGWVAEAAIAVAR